MRSRSKKRLALSFVLTFAAAPACKQATAPQAPVDGEATGAGTTSTAAEQTPPPKDYGASSAPDGAARLPPAPTAGKITRQADGTCFWEPPPCPGTFPCNPPAPHAVECPPSTP